jgi:amino acid adenylation domain-containing protein/non-ribosomal peptide synthase protein (TIGR01720 family)
MRQCAGIGSEAHAFPVSLAQKRLWILEQLSPGTVHYNLAGAVRLRNAVYPDVLCRAVNEIISRHESLRTTFQAVDQEPVQLIWPSCRIALPIVDLRRVPELVREAEAQKVIRQEIRQPFDLSQRPLLRLKLLRLAEQEYILILAMHHIISDGWSTGVFFRELTELYSALAQGKRSPLPDLPIQYVDYAVWQREWLGDCRLANQLAYWRSQLAGVPTLEVPTDHPRPVEASFRGARLPLTLSGASVERLKSHCQQEGATLFMGLLAAFQTLMHRYSGQDDIAVGTPVAGRNRPELEGLIGFFVNTLVLRLDLTGNPTFREILRRTKAMALDAYEHQDVPFEKLVEELKPERDPSRNPLFQVSFQLLQFPGSDGMRRDGSFPSSTPLDVDCGTASFDLSVDLWEEPSGCAGRIEYSTDLFERDTIKRLARHFSVLVDRVVVAPNLRLSEFNLLTPEETMQLRACGNITPCTGDSLECVHRLFERHVERAPHAVALLHRSTPLSYRALNDRADRFASKLRTLGVVRDSVVALHCPRSAELVVGMLGVLKAGGAYLVLDQTHPNDRLSDILDNAQAQVIVTTRSLNPPPSRRNVALVYLEECEGGGQAAGPPSSGDSFLFLDSLAYIVYTSGSSGRPNGCLIPHRALASHCVAVANHYHLHEGDRVLQFASPAFDVISEEIFPTLARGATLVLSPPDGSASFPEFMDLVAKAKLTVLNLPAGFWHAWVSYLAETRAELPSSLRLVIVGSDNVLARYVAQWQQLAPSHIRLCNAYGVSEATITSTVFDVPAHYPHRSIGSIPIGRPIANTQVFVLDQYRQPVPVGVPGELYIGGLGLARGYLGQPELTAARFVYDSAGENPRLYRTGDRVRLLRDGNLECLGRIDNQISVRGFRVEPEEVEGALLQHPAVFRAAVVATSDPHGENQLVAYVVAKPGSNVSAYELRSALAGRLPRHMVPSLFAMVPQLPLTVAGKVDRQALRSKPRPEPRLETDYALPTTPAEEALAAIWAETLGLQRVGIHDNFFGLGGDSILIIRIMSRANQAGLRLTPMQIFKHQTVAELAAAAEIEPAFESEKTVSDAPFPLTPIQQWWADQDLPNSHHYNQALLLPINSELDVDALRQAIGHLLVRHDALRMRFTRGSQGWRQHYGNLDESVPFEVEDLSLIAESARAAELSTRTARVQCRLDLTRGPLLRAVLFTSQPGFSRLLIVIHHLVVDGISWRILTDDLWAAYRQIARREPVQFPPKTASFQRWATRLGELAQSGTLAAQLDLFLALPFERIRKLPIDFAEGENVVGSEATVSIALGPDETQEILQGALKWHRAEINDLLLSALVLALAEWSGSTAQLIDVEAHGREPLFEDCDVSDTVGWFTVICPYLLDPGRTSDAVTALKHIKAQLRSIPNHGIGYGLLRYLSGDQSVRKRLASLPKAELSFNYMGRFTTPAISAFLELPPESCGPTRDPAQPRGYLLEINGHLSAAGLKFDWTFNRHRHRAATIREVAECFRRQLLCFLDRRYPSQVPAYVPSDFPLANLDQAQLDKLLRKIGVAARRRDHDQR